MKSKKPSLLTPNEVHIWSACLSENENNVPYFATLLSWDEQEKATHFRLSRDQKRYIISRAILKCLLSEYLREEPQTIDILYGLWGKPCLAKEKGLFFNLSHSEDYVLYAFTQEYEVGIDVEYINETLDLEDMAPSVFSIEELSHWRSLSLNEKTSAFFKSWVSKEAILKASGKGWLENHQEITLPEANDFKKAQESALCGDNKTVYPYCFEFIAGYASALFIEGPFLQSRYFIW